MQLVRKLNLSHGFSHIASAASKAGLRKFASKQRVVVRPCPDLIFPSERVELKLLLVACFAFHSADHTQPRTGAHTHTSQRATLPWGSWVDRGLVQIGSRAEREQGEGRCEQVVASSPLLVALKQLTSQRCVVFSCSAMWCALSGNQMRCPEL